MASETLELVSQMKRQHQVAVSRQTFALEHAERRRQVGGYL